MWSDSLDGVNVLAVSVDAQCPDIGSHLVIWIVVAPDQRKQIDMDTKLRLDDLYKMIAHIYSEQNAQRSATTTFAHFVEVCGMLTINARDKKRESFTFVDAMCKVFGWYFPLLAKFKVASVEDLVFRKFPYACPYCHLTPHDPKVCKTTRTATSTIDQAVLRRIRETNRLARPTSFDGWQRMFQAIYPRTTDDAYSGRSILGLLEELGELAEAVRVFDRYPKYFAGEAADVFSYLMGLANEYALLAMQANEPPFSLENALVERYPGLCVQCGHIICVCPVVPETTVGRMAKELDIDDLEQLFVFDHEQIRTEGIAVCLQVLGSAGGYTGLMKRFPFDPESTNKAVVEICLCIADSICDVDSGTADTLRSAALRIGAAATSFGDQHPRGQLEKLVTSLESKIKELP